MARTRGGSVRAAAVFVLAFGYFALFIHYGFNVDDEGTLLAQFYRTYLGQIPYRDFHMGYTPAGHYLQARLFGFFGVSVVPLRVALAVCHSACAALLFAIGRRTMPTAFAALPPIAYVAMLPFYPGEFASFNIPYPAWYVTLFWLAGLWALLRFVETGRLGWVAGSGVLVGLCFAFKPNVGLFQLAGSGLVLLIALEPAEKLRAERLENAVWWLLAFGVAAGLSFVFASQASARDVRIFLWPIFVVLLTLALRRIAGRGGNEHRLRRLTGSVVVLGVAMIAVVLPWTLTFLSLLGVQRFARQILFIGTGFEQFYYLRFHGATSWDRALVLVALGILAVGLLVRMRLLAPWVVALGAAIAAAAGAWAAIHAPMPEGPHAALVSRLEDLSFGATLVMQWAAVASLMPLLWRRHRSRRHQEQILVLASGLAMYLQLYPRSDFMHLVAAVPLTLVIGAGLAARIAAWFDVVPGWSRRVCWATLAAGIALALVRVGPNLAAVIQWRGGPSWRMQAALDLDRAPVALEIGRAPRLRDLHDVVRFIDTNTAPGEAIFPFPAIELVCFLADRPNATRHGYFFPGWPGHEVEAEVVSALRTAPPRFVVVLHAHQFFFINAPMYYYALREFVGSHYRWVRSFGPYTVLARHDVADDELRDAVGASPDAGAIEREYGARLAGIPAERLAALRELWVDRLDFAWEPVLASLVDDDPRIRDAAVWALASAVSDPDVAAAYARAILQGAVPDDLRTLVLRRVWSFGDARVIQPTLELMHPPVDPEERSVALGILESIGRKLAIRDHWFGARTQHHPDATFGPSVPEEAVRLLRRRSSWAHLADPDEDPRFRSFLADVLPRLGPVRGATETLYMTLGAGSPYLRLAAAAGLLRMRAVSGPDALTFGTPSDLTRMVLPLVARDQVFAPSLLLRLYRRDPAGTRRMLLRGLDEPYVVDRVTIAWIVSATGDRHFRRPLIRLLKSPVGALRLAALAGLERIADPRTRPALVRASEDPDFEVREFAQRALRALPQS
jgi:hypothetical protein